MTQRTPPENDLQHGVRKGRGSGSNQASRYLPTRSIAVDDGWSSHQDADEGPDQAIDGIQPALSTRFYPDRTKTLITTNKSPDIPFSQSINPYKGCEHGCIYCFARPTHAFLDLSPGLDFESRIFFKTNIRECLHKELGKPGYRCSTIAMGTNTDPYQPGEKNHRVMREILSVLAACRHPISIVTKSALILRDLDLLGAMAEDGLVSVNVSVTTLDNELKRKLEPRTAGPAARLRTIEKLREAGVPTGAMIAPVIPFINDAEIEDLVSACAGAGAQVLRYILLRLPLEVKPLFEEWLHNHYPQRAERVMSAVRSTRGGRAYRAQWHKRMVGEGQMAELIRARFMQAQRKAGLGEAELPGLRCDLFQPPRPDSEQLDLFC
ncbi:MAG: PA0069 family radical SAM protein [Pseudomonadota bacterium]